VREHEKEVTANEAAAAQQSSALKAQQQALDERQRSLDEVRAELSSKVSVTPPPSAPLAAVPSAGTSLGAIRRTCVIHMANAVEDCLRAR
jgi:hypothetical protein